MSVQVRIVRDKKEHSKNFTINEYGGIRKMITAARSWRNKMLEKVGTVNRQKLNCRPLKNKTSTSVKGVYLSISYDKRNGNFYMSYGVCWYKKDESHKRSKKFFLGLAANVNPDDQLHAFRTAVRFRQEFLLCREQKEPFHPENFRQWKTVRLYDQGLVGCSNACWVLRLPPKPAPVKLATNMKK